MPLIKLKFLVYIVLKLIAILDNVTQSAKKFIQESGVARFLKTSNLNYVMWKSTL